MQCALASQRNKIMRNGCWGEVSCITMVKMHKDGIASSHPLTWRAARVSSATRLSLVLAMLAGLLLRLFFLLRFPYTAGDSLIYGDIAHNLLVHHVYGFARVLDGAAGAPRPTLIRLPGYPLFLAGCFRVFGLDRFTPVLFVQTMVDLGTCGLLSATAWRLFDQRAGVAALWLAALCPFTANYAAAPLTETLTLFCIAAAFFCLGRWRDHIDGAEGAWFNRWLLLLALALAYAILLRPEQGLLAAAVLPALIWSSLQASRSQGVLRALRPALAVALLTILPLLPWTLRNWQVFHVFEPLAPRFATDPGESNPFGFQRWYRTWAIDFASTEDVYWLYDGTPIQISELPRRAFDNREQFAATDALLSTYNDNADATPEIDARFNVLGLERIRNHAFRYYIGLPFGRLFNMTFRPRTEMLPVPVAWWRFRNHMGSSLFALAFACLNLMFITLAAFTAIRRDFWSRRDPLLWCMLATIGMRCALLLTLDNSEPRYTLEFYPVLLILGSATIAGWGLCARSTSTR